VPFRTSTDIGIPDFVKFIEAFWQTHGIAHVGSLDNVISPALGSAIGYRRLCALTYDGIYRSMRIK
jgi:hypothetical protein